MNGLLSTYAREMEAAELALKKRQFKSATRFLHEAVALANSVAEDTRAKRMLGYAYRMLGYLLPAQKELELAEARSSTAGDLVSVGTAQRLIAEVLYDRANLEADVETREELLDQCEDMLMSSLRNIDSIPELMVVMEHSATINLIAALQCERGNKVKGLELFKNSVVDFNVKANEHVLVRSVLRHMRYSPTHRLQSLRFIWRLTARDNELLAYRPLALKALIGLKVHL